MESFMFLLLARDMWLNGDAVLVNSVIFMDLYKIHAVGVGVIAPWPSIV